VIKQKYLGLFMGMGLGKTVIALNAAVELMYDYFAVSKCLIIAPLRVAHDTWSRELDKWAGLEGIRLTKVLGSESERVTALQAHSDFYVINRENVVWLVDHPEYYPEGRWPFDMVIVDEFSSFKNRKSKRWRALRTVRPRIKRFIGLTGTPAANGLIDLWPEVYLLDGGKRLGRTVSKYRQKYFSAGASNGHVVYEWRPDDDAEDRIFDKIKDICVSMKAEDYLSETTLALPPKVIEVDMSPRERKLYRKLKQDLIVQYLDKTIVAANAGVLCGKLMQLANGAIYDSPEPGEDPEVLHVHDRKLEALDEIVESAEWEGEPLLIYYSFKHDLKRLKKRYPQAVKLTGSDVIAKWNRGEIPILLAQPASAGYGLNLQDGGHIIVWFGLTFSLEYYEQANARLARQGQKKPVVIYQIITKDTIDHKILAALDRKSLTQNELMDAVKAVL
jgi:SNF2 family DNA or RNA helicase